MRLQSHECQIIDVFLHGGRRVIDFAPLKCLFARRCLNRRAFAFLLGHLRLIDAPVCNVLGIPFAYDQGEGAISPAALAEPPTWDRARAAVAYDEASRRIVHALKYRDTMEAGLLMARLMARAGQPLIGEADVIIPVPLHRFRLWGRRFNQAAFLSQQISRQFGKAYRRTCSAEPGARSRWA
jgi:predicted amidophosphoribosyltransferase